MLRHVKLELERDLATARRAMFKAIGTAERACEFGWEEDLRMVNQELARLMDAAIRDRDPRQTTIN